MQYYRMNNKLHSFRIIYTNKVYIHTAKYNIYTLFHHMLEHTLCIHQKRIEFSCSSALSSLA